MRDLLHSLQDRVVESEVPVVDVHKLWGNRSNMVLSTYSPRSRIHRQQNVPEVKQAIILLFIFDTKGCCHTTAWFKSYHGPAQQPE